MCTAVLFRGLVDSPRLPSWPEAWRAELDRLLEHRLSGLALAAAHEEGVSIPAEVDEALHHTHEAEAMRTMAVDLLGARVVETLAGVGIATVVTKGPGIAGAYPDPSLRTYMDLDIVVSRSDFSDALAVLRGKGYDESVHMQARDYFHRYCREAINLVHPDGTSVDLHHTIPPWYWGERIGFDALLGASERLDTGSGPIRVASYRHNLLVAALHVVSDKDRPGYGLRTWRDVAALVERCDPDEVAGEARRCRLGWWLRFVLDELPASERRNAVLSRLRSDEPGARDRLRLRFLLPPAVGSRHIVGRVFRLPVSNGAAFLAGEVVPSRESIQTKLGPDSSYLDWWRYAGGRLLARLRERDDSG